MKNPEELIHYEFNFQVFLFSYQTEFSQSKIIENILDACKNADVDVAEIKIVKIPHRYEAKLWLGVGEDIEKNEDPIEKLEEYEKKIIKAFDGEFDGVDILKSELE